MLFLFREGDWPCFDVSFTPASEAHLFKHTSEDPEVQPHFVERLIREAEPNYFYFDPQGGRFVFEGYLMCRPYRVVVEISIENGHITFFPVSAHRIRDRVFIRRVAAGRRERI